MPSSICGSTLRGDDEVDANLDPELGESKTNKDEIEVVERELATTDSANANDERKLLSQHEAVPKSFRRLVVGMCLLFLVVIEIAQFMTGAPTQQIMEDIICKEYFPDHSASSGAIDPRCKTTEVQKTLAMVRSWSLSAQLFAQLLVQVPYGVVADKFGRRWVLFLSLLGYAINQTWVNIVLLYPNQFNIWSMLYGNVIYIVGGGSQMSNAMIFTLLADVTESSKQGTMFGRIVALNLLLAAAINPLSGVLLNMNPWIPMWIGHGLLILGVLSSLLIPETLQARQSIQNRSYLASANARREQESQNGTDEQPSTRNLAWLALKTEMRNVWNFIFASRSIMIFIIGYGGFFIVKLAITQDLLQYMTRRFSWKWSEAVYISTVGNVTTVILLLGVLPYISKFLTKRYKFNPASRDLHLSRISIVIIMVGCLLIGFAPSTWFFIFSLVIGSLGFGFMTLSRAVLMAIVEPGTIATMNTTISTMETFMGLIGAPATGWLLSKGIELGGLWTGLPYFACAIISALVSIVTILFRLPQWVRDAEI